MVRQEIYRRTRTRKILLLVGLCVGVCILKPLSAHAETLRPTELDIPVINSSIPVINVGLTVSNNLDVPHNFTQAGWYDNGPLPGEKGSAVIDGHVDNGGQTPTIAGVFKNLRAVTVGNIVNVHFSNKTSVTFKVISSNVYSYDDFPSASVFASSSDKAYLKIITCHGTWLPRAHTYSERLVVTAERVS